MAYTINIKINQEVNGKKVDELCKIDSYKM